MAVSDTLPQSRRDVALRIFADIQAEVPELNPFLKEHIVKAIATGYAGRLFDIYQKIALLEQEFFLQTAKDLIFIQRWGYLKKITKKPAAFASGFIPFTGVAGSTIPEGTLLNNVSGQEYEVIEQDYEIIPVSININSIANDGAITTVQTGTEHNFSINTVVTITNVIPISFNGTFTIIEITDNTTIKYSQVLTPGVGSDGDISIDMANAEIKSAEVGVIQNLENGAQLTLKNPITNVNNDAYIPYNGITGGADEETTTDYKDRVIDAWRNPFAYWNAAFIEQTVLNVPGVTRTWVRETTPEVGDVTIYFVRDNDENIFPSPGEIQEVKDVLLESKPVDRSDSQVIVSAPTKLGVDFVFTNLSPDTQTMRTAIQLSLEQFFKESVSVGQDVPEDAYRCAIKSTISDSGETVIAFTLASPTGDISVASDELPTLGDINY